MKHLFLIWIPVLSWVAMGQTPASLSVQVSRTLTLTLDEAAFTITAGTSLEGTAQQVKQALEDNGIPNPTVTAIGLRQDTSVLSGAAQILYQATATVAAGSAKDASRNLENLRTHLPAPLTSLTYSAVFNPGQAAMDSARQAILPKLLAEAQTKAQSLAAASGLKLGSIRSVTDSALGTPAGVGAGFAVPVLINGVLSANPVSFSPTPVLSLNVIFGTAP